MNADLTKYTFKELIDLLSDAERKRHTENKVFRAKFVLECAEISAELANRYVDMHHYGDKRS